MVLVAAAAFAAGAGPARSQTNGAVSLTEPLPPAAGVFEAPRWQAVHARKQAVMLALMASTNWTGAETIGHVLVEEEPRDATAWYNLACAQARQGRGRDALASLAQSVSNGFWNVRHIEADPDMASLRSERTYRRLLDEARRRTADTNALYRVTVRPSPVTNAVAWVTASNTVWDPGAGLLRVFFEFPDAAPTGQPPVTGFGEAGDLLRRWYGEGTAAGLHGDLYDNHDGDHANMGYAAFPALSRVEYGPEAMRQGLSSGLQVLFVFNRPTLGNSSTALVDPAFWRSQPRLAMLDPRAMLVLYNQYVGNHLYVYPEHRDYDPGRDGEGGGYGDVHPANTPYVLISQGSSGSDRVFLEALACTLAAFRPEVKALLVRRGVLMPTVQMVFRTCNKPIGSPEKYLTGAAHPSVFQGADLDTPAMVRMAHAMSADAVPPMIQLKVVEEDEPVPRRDYFDVAERGERLFDTPAAIARVFRTVCRERRIVVSAEASRDLNGRPLTWRWVALLGDAERVRIRPLNRSGSVAEIIVPWPARRPIAPGAKMESNRVDIGVFAHNGRYYSAPGFVTFYGFDNEKRECNESGRLLSVDYADPVVSRHYVDPGLGLTRDWRDDYRYDPRGRLLGWARTRGSTQEVFTADGALVLEQDARGRPLRARTQRYVAVPRRDGPPRLLQLPGAEILHYAYASASDAVGRIARREPVAVHPAAEPESGLP
jgi:hypothetical protein